MISRRDESPRDPLPTRYFADLARHPLLSTEAEHALATAFVATGDPAAFKTLVTAHLRLVVKIAREYARREHDVFDLVQEGNLGLIEAVRRYDPRRGVKLASYAGWWIRAYILKYLMENARIVRVVRSRDERRRFFQGELPPREASLDEPRRGGASVADAVADDAELRPDLVLEQKEASLLLERGLAKVRRSLDPRETLILDERLLAEDPPPLHALGARLCVTGERVRQIEKSLVRRLRDLPEQQLAA